MPTIKQLFEVTDVTDALIGAVERLVPCIIDLLESADTNNIATHLARYDRLVDERDRELGKLGDPDVDEITYHPRYDEIVSNFDHDFAELLHDLIHDIRHIGEPT